METRRRAAFWLPLVIGAILTTIMQISAQPSPAIDPGNLRAVCQNR
jgi:hypothetical protein